MRVVYDAATGQTVVDDTFQATPADVRTEPRTTITRAQLRMWLYDHGVQWSDVLAWAQAQPAGPDRDKLMILLEDAVEFDRTDPRIRAAALALPLGLNEGTVDAALEQAWREAGGTG